MPKEPWEIELDRLRDEFRRALPAKLAGLDGLLCAALGTTGREGLEALHREAHSLKGSAGSYGFDQVSRELQQIEDALAGVLAAAGPEPHPAASEVAELRPALEGALARARAALPSA